MTRSSSLRRRHHHHDVVAKLFSLLRTRLCYVPLLVGWTWVVWRPLIQHLSHAMMTTDLARRMDLPSANHKKYNFTVAICTIVKDEEAYLTEWMDYNLMALEFDNIYIYDNSAKFDLERWYNHTRSHPIYKRVTVRHFPMINQVQRMAYGDCMRRYGKSHDYVAIIDFDEYIVLQQDNHTMIHDVIAEYLEPYGGALTMNWMLMGTSNKTMYAPLPILKRFQRREAKPHNVIKTIVKSLDFHSMRNPHAVQLAKNKNVRTTLYPGAVQKEQFGATGASDHAFPSQVVLLYHYRYLSIKEYTIRRCVRGEAGGFVKGCNDDGTLSNNVPDHNIHRPGTVFDDKAWKFFTSKVPKYRVFDGPEFEDFT